MTNPEEMKKAGSDCSTCFRCPAGYSTGITRNGETFTDLLLENNVSFEAMQAANPGLPTTRLAPGTRYCIPPTGMYHVCTSGSRSYLLAQGEDLNTTSQLFGIAPGLLLAANPQLAPSDFVPGTIVCLP